MFKSIFSKQFSTYVGTLSISFVILGLALTSIFQSFFVNQKTETLVKQGRKIAYSYANLVNANTNIFQSSIYRNQFMNDMNMISALGASCFVLNYNQEVMAMTPDITTLKPGDIVEDVVVTKVFDGETVVVQGNVGGIFNDKVMTVGYPIIVNGFIWGAIFMNAPMTEVYATNQAAMRIIFLCVVASLAGSFILVYISSKTISKPIHQISEAAKEIANGDFEKRLAVHSRDEVGQLAESFNNMAESLENNEKSRREFIANISHDLRSPLTSMRGFLQAIIDGTIPPEKHEKYLNIVLTESERLSKLANDILDISKIQSFEVELNRTDFDVNEMIRRIILMLEARITNKEIEMHISFADEKNFVNADEEKISRVIYNLMDNAIKFTEPEGAISVMTNTKDDKVYVTVKDNGIGVDKEKQKLIFDRFYKADASRGEDKTGSGLGLSIVKEFIKAHGENITLVSEVNEGSEFVFSLPSVAQ